MKLFIQNMVSLRCKLFVKSKLENLGLFCTYLELGEVHLSKPITLLIRQKLAYELHLSGLELMNDKKMILVERIKNVIVEISAKRLGVTAVVESNKVIGIITDGKLKQVKVFGELKKGVSAPYNTIWNVASLTKPITAMVTLKLVSQGKWNLDEPIYKYWTDPDVAKDPNSKILTTRHLLSHQSGFKNWRFINHERISKMLTSYGVGSLIRVLGIPVP